MDQNDKEISRAERKRLKAEKKRQKDEKKKLKQLKMAEQRKQNELKKKEKAESAQEPLESDYVDATPQGQKKDPSIPMLKKYNPFQVEAAWDAWWEAKGFYKPEVNESKHNTADDEKFVMVIPPPNVTGSLHIGHALMCTIEDCLVRWHRMCGKTTIWLPGLDHAGIATQTVVEKMIFKERGQTRHDLEREAFVDEIWKWRENYGGKICAQIRKLGSSPDWSREVFTMDEKLSRAVTEAFVRMYEQGKIYRSTRLVNWSCALATAVADCEVDKIDLDGGKENKLSVPGHERKIEFGVMWTFGYRLCGDGETEQILVGTTRPETMLGDVAVAVHPEDERYKPYHGKLLQHPFLDRTIPIICDAELVDPTKGTGAVKVTPAHDENDFKCGLRHDLEQINILTVDGKINDNGGKFEGMMRYDARYAVINDLKRLGLYHGQELNEQALGFCSRSKDVIEPVLRPQWWVDCKDAARRSVEAVKNGDLKITPKKEERVFFHFLDNIRDWCVSRQLWWGHRIPAYFPVIKGQPELDSDGGDHWIIARSFEEAMEKAKVKYPDVKPEDISLEQDEDVLDTWFSSGLFPFSVFGWPDNTPDLEKFYPGTLLETGSDILFFWVARMTMMSLQLNDKLPFKEVFLHPMVRDKFGQKISKSRGNVIDPLHIIHGCTLQQLLNDLKIGNLDQKDIDKYTTEKTKLYPTGIKSCGADALRFGLLSYMSQGGSINLDVNRVTRYREAFCNKMWQACNFALPKLSGESFVPPTSDETLIAENTPNWADKWILSRLTDTEQTIQESMKAYDFATAASALRNFWLKELCSVFLETLKPMFPRGDQEETKDDTSERKSARRTLYICLDRGLKLTHPFMPFISEELFQRLPGRKPEDSIMIERYPTGIDSWRNLEIEDEMKIVSEIVSKARNEKNEMGIANATPPQLYITFKNEEVSRRIAPRCEVIATLAKFKNVEVTSADDERLKRCAAALVNVEIDIFIVTHGVVNFDKQLASLRNKRVRLEGLTKSYEKKLESDRLPENVRTGLSQKFEESNVELQRLVSKIDRLTQMKMRENS